MYICCTFKSGLHEIPTFIRTFFLWIGEQPCIQMDFWHLSRNNTYVSIPGKLLDIHLLAWLFSNPWGKVLFLLQSMGQIYSLDLILLRTFFPGLEGNITYKWISGSFPGMLTYVLLLENFQKSIYICTLCLFSSNPTNLRTNTQNGNI